MSRQRTTGKRRLVGELLEQRDSLATLIDPNGSSNAPKAQICTQRENDDGNFTTMFFQPRRRIRPPATWHPTHGTN